MRTLQIDKKIFSVPASWRDLDPDHVIKIAELADKGLSHHEFRISLLRILLGITVVEKPEIIIDGITYYYFRHGITREFLISEIDVSFIISIFDFMFRKITPEMPDDTYALHYTEVRNLVPEIKTTLGVLHGPADGLSNLLLSEYIHAETAWSNFRKTGKFHFAVRLFAILYRPKAAGINTKSPNYNGDPREPFNDFLLSDRTAALITTNRGSIAFVVHWYEACRDFINRKWPEVFEGGQKADEKTDAFTGFMKMVNSLADNDVTKNNEVRQSYLYDVMFTLQSILIQDKKMKDKLKGKK